ncbi:hypothetical protein [Parvibaculum sp. MBR-TMA-1.3b-4.2]|jgi:hypothetical protein
MGWRFNRETTRIESDDPEVFVEYLAAHREEGDEFILHMQGKKIGFRTADFWKDDTSERMPDGTKVWSFDWVACRVVRWDYETRKPVTLAKEYRFSSKEEQDEVLRTFADALAVFDGNRKPDDPASIKARVEFTDRMKACIEAGELLK